MRLSLALLLTGTLLIAGCGGGDDPGSSSKPSASATKAASAASEKEWAAEVTNVCTKSQKAARKAAVEGQQKGLEQRALVAYVLDKSIPIQKDLVEDLDAIEAPADIQGDYDQLVSQTRAGP